jgi:two-component system, NarL family, invasion response regulator UvrY
MTQVVCDGASDRDAAGARDACEPWSVPVHGHAQTGMSVVPLGGTATPRARDAPRVAIRVLVADRHAIVRSGFRQFAAAAADISVAGEASNGAQTLALVRERAYDVVLLDIELTDRDSIDTLRAIRHVRPDQPVLMLAGRTDSACAVNLLRAGASGCLSKGAEPAEMVRAVRLVARGHCYLPESVADVLAARLDRPDVRPVHEALSQREFQIFCKLARGQVPTAIADELHLSVKTVSTYRARVLEKMKLSNNADLTRYALRHGLIE